MTKLNDEEREIMAAFERGRTFKGAIERTSTTSILSIRVSDDLLRGLSDLAAASDQPVSTYARDLLERFADEGGPKTPSSLARMFTRWARENETSDAPEEGSRRVV